MSITKLAAVVYAAVTAFVVAFQLALALGAPWGEYAMGGAFPGRFPAKMRVAAVVQAVLLAAMAGLILSVAGLALPQWSAAPSWLAWAVVGFCAASVLLNLITPSASERRIWVPATVVLLVSSATVILTAG